MSDVSFESYITIRTSSFPHVPLPLFLFFFFFLFFFLPLLPLFLSSLLCSIYLFIVILGHLGFCIAFLDGSFEHLWFSSCISGIGPVLLCVAI